VSRSFLIAAMLFALAGTTMAVDAGAQAPLKKPASAQSDPLVGQLMVKLRAPTAVERVQTLGASRVSALSKSAGIALESVRPMSGDATVMRLPAAMPLSQAQAVIDRLQADPAIEWVSPDLPVRRLQTQVPPDQGYLTLQWNLFPPTQVFQSAVATGGTKDFVATGGANLPAAWARSVGNAAITVAIVDTGVVGSQRDLNGRLLPGYDFISSTALTSLGVFANFVANDGDGRDPDASDPGDWVTAAEKTAYPNACADGVAADTSSSWHGTHMSGIVAAQWGNDINSSTGGLRPGTRIAGIAPAVRILPVRALGKCGGTSSDVIDGMRWAAGLSVPGIPANANPARVINLSLGGSPGACASAYASAVTEVIARGVVIVAASGNDTAVNVLQPANCTGVIAVTAHVINGDNADYSNVGPEIALSAPGGGLPSLLDQINPPLVSSDNAFVIWSTGLFGSTTPTSAVSNTDNRSGDALLGLTGTSPATPHVSAAAALLLSINPNLTPADVRTYLVNTTRPHPVGGYCASQTSSVCGFGLLDVGAALTALLPTAPAALPVPPPLPPEPAPPPPPSGGGGSLPLWPVVLLFALGLARDLRRRSAA